ncbi:hypothetical protein [Reichenbachiella sp.]|uniref:hypothetical protein n=1 Tax=Reichenbachiella sp. TaxID=2184521 RepID=UPI003B59C488
MAKDSEIRALLWQLIKSNMPIFQTGQCYEAVVVSVDSDELTCEIRPADYEDEDFSITARFTSVVDDVDSYLVALPVVDSTVLVQAIKDNPDDVYVAKVREVSELRFKVGQTTGVITGTGVVIDGGSLGGIPITSKVIERLNLIEQKINDLSQIFSGWTPASNDGGAALKGALSGWSTLTESSDADIENDRIKQ